MFVKFLKLFPLTLSICAFLFSSVSASAPIRVNPKYEDTIRIAFIWNDAEGSTQCQSSLNPVGLKTLQFALRALDTTKVKNVKIIQNSQNNKVQWSDVVAMWGADRLPHNIVHVNAGWSIGWNGPELDTIFSRAVQNKVGIVSIGDDAAHLASNTFGFDSISNVPEPLGDGTTIDSLWIGLLRANDEKLKTYVGGNTLQYPGLNGIISNAIDSVLKGNNLPFFPFGQGRCQADADKYNIRYPQWITMLGYQQGYDAGKTVNGPNELNVLVAIQDTIQKTLIRRAVALSFQPQFLRDSIAAQQIVYDAIMFTSLTHTLSVPDKLFLKLSSDSVKAGDKVQITADLYDQNNIPMTDKLPLIQWKIIDPVAGDTLYSLTGGTTEISSTKAWRLVTIQADFTDPETNGSVSTQVKVYIKPGDPDHLDISTSSATPNLNSDIADVSISFVRSHTSTPLFAFVRDRFQNYVSVANDCSWVSSDTKVVTVTADNANSSKGTVVKVDGGTTFVYVKSGDLKNDTADVFVAENSFVRTSFTRDTDGNGYIDMIELHFDSSIVLSDPTSILTSLKIYDDHKIFKVSDAALRNGTSDSILYVKVEQDSDGPLQTGWRCNVEGSVSIVLNNNEDKYNVAVKQLAQDGAGPVLSRAIYLYSGKNNVSDTVLLITSEPVTTVSINNTKPGDVFIYYNFKRLFEAVELLANSSYKIATSKTYTDTVKVALDINTASKYIVTPYKDSIQMIDNIRDSSSNTAPSRDLSRKVKLESGGNNSIMVSVLPNPLNFDKIKITDFPKEIRDKYQEILEGHTDGLLIIVQTKKTLKALDKGTYGKVKIYDALGNIVLKDIILKQASTPQDYGFVWDGMNTKGRKCGAGTYLMVISVTDSDGQSFSDQKKIGIAMSAPAK